MGANSYVIDSNLSNIQINKKIYCDFIWMSTTGD